MKYAKSLLLIGVLMLFMVGVASATDVPHQLSGGVIVTKVSGAASQTETIPYNVKLPSSALCNAAVVKIEQAFFSPLAAVTQGLPSEGDARKLVFLQCLPLTATVAP